MFLLFLRWLKPLVRLSFGAMSSSPFSLPLLKSHLYNIHQSSFFIILTPLDQLCGADASCGEFSSHPQQWAVLTSRAINEFALTLEPLWMPARGANDLFFIRNQAVTQTNASV